MLKLLKSPTYLLIAFGITLILFNLQFYLLKNLPGNINNACTPGAYFTTQNLIFAAAIGILAALNIIGIIESQKQKFKNKKTDTKNLKASETLSTIGLFFATLTSFCTICVLPVVSLFGIGISLAFFTTYLIWFKSLSVILLAISLYFTNKQLNNNCHFCID